MADVEAVLVTLFTNDDDKDKEEHVTTSIVFDQNELLAQSIRGAGEVFPDHSQQTFGLKLSRAIPESDSGRMKVVVTKSTHGSDTGNGWNMSIAVTGRLAGGGTKPLLNQTGNLRMGDSNPVTREFAFQ
jgi:hypothetical protein